MPTMQNLPDNLILVTDSQDLESILESVSLPAEYRGDITGALIGVCEGDYTEVYLTESCAPYALCANYHKLAYYRPESWKVENLPGYWKD